MRYGIAVGLCMVALGACQVATLPQVVDGREEYAAAERARLFDRGTLTVMTRGLSGGRHLERVLEARWEEEPARAAELLESLRPEELQARASQLADEIQQARPHLVGLQQVMRARLRPTGEALFGGARPAETVSVDMLPVLLGELAVRGLHYREVARVSNADVELPLRTSGARAPGGARLTDFDVILARADVEVKEARAGNYVARREVPRPGQEPVALPRGWASVAAKVEGRTYRFVSTHLEPAPDEHGLRVQVAQAGELIRTLRGEPLPVVLVGDFNTPANLGLLGAPTYRELLLAGYVDVWTHRMGSTLPVGGGMGHELPVLAERLNLVLVRKPVAPGVRRVGPVLAYGVGGALEERTGPWKMDLAAGVVARLRI